MGGRGLAGIAAQSILQMTIPTSRPYSGTTDLQSILDLLVAVKPAERITDFPTHRESVLQ